MNGSPVGLTVFGTPVEFVLFAATLLGVALLQRHTLAVAVIGLSVIAAYKIVFTGFDEGAGLGGLGAHLLREWVILANLALLLTGFAILSRLFEQSSLPDLAPDILPAGWLGGVTLLLLVFVVSAFLDNIASALIGATVARHVYQGRVQIAFLAAIVAAANAGGAGSVVGDTTTTMMWIAGKSPFDVLHAYVGSAASPGRVCCSRRDRPGKTPAGPQTRCRRNPRRLDTARNRHIHSRRCRSREYRHNIVAPQVSDLAPVIGLAVWAAILLSALVRKIDWRVLPDAGKGTLFLLALVLCASLMPVKALPPASGNAQPGCRSQRVFDNIPLTALALNQGGDWGMLAFAVGFGGSMV